MSKTLRIVDKTTRRNLVRVLMAARNTERTADTMKDPTLAEVASFLDGMAAQIIQPIEAREAMQARARVVRKAESDLDYARLQTREAFAMIEDARKVQDKINQVSAKFPSREEELTRCRSCNVELCQKRRANYIEGRGAMIEYANNMQEQIKKVFRNGGKAKQGA